MTPIADMVEQMLMDMEFGAEFPWPKTRLVILHRDQRICSYCYDDATHVDHVLPLSRGGRNNSRNLLAACAPCNQSKGTLTPEQWAARDGFPLPPIYFDRMFG